MEINDIVNNAAKYKDIQNMELLGITLYEKHKPFYNTKILGVPLKYILGGMVFYHLIRKIK